MNPPICEREDQTSAAIRSGIVDREIASHIQDCPVCSEILLVAAFLRANDAAVEPASLPVPSLIWQKAKRRATERTVRKALRPIRFMKIIACIVFACSPWLRWLLPLGRELSASWPKSFDFNLSFVSKAWPATAASETTLLLGLSGTILLLGLSSWYMLREE